MVKVTGISGTTWYTNNYIIELEGKSPMSEEGMEEIINSFSNVKAGEIYEIEYSAAIKRWQICTRYVCGYILHTMEKTDTNSPGYWTNQL